MISEPLVGAAPRAHEDVRFYRPELDLLRLIAFALVFAHHVLPRTPDLYPSLPHSTAAFLAALANAGGFGLSLFFVLSGYLITTLLLLEHQRTGTVRLGAFYGRRALRIWPLYIVGLTIGVAWAVGVEGTDTAMFVSYVTFTGNWWFQTHRWGANPMTPLWSISIEEQFYLVFPALLVVLGVRRLPWIGGGLIGLSLVGLVAQGEAHRLVDTAIWTSTASQMIFLGTGVLLAWRMQGSAVRLTGSVRVVLSAAAVALLVLAAAGTEVKFVGEATSGISVAGGYALVALACAMIMVAVADVRCTIPHVLLRGGQLSFALYVFHQLALEQARSLVGDLSLLVPFAGLLLSIVYALVADALIERPTARWRHRLAIISSGAPDDRSSGEGSASRTLSSSPRTKAHAPRLNPSSTLPSVVR